LVRFGLGNPRWLEPFENLGAIGQPCQAPEGAQHFAGLPGGNVSAYLESEGERWGQIVRSRGIKAE
jgi:hypothetical protein